MLPPTSGVLGPSPHSHLVRGDARGSLLSESWMTGVGSRVGVQTASLDSVGTLSRERTYGTTHSPLMTSPWSISSGAPNGSSVSAHGRTCWETQKDVEVSAGNGSR